MTSTGVAFGSMAGVRTTIKTAQATPVAHATPRVDPRDSRSQAHPRLCRRPAFLPARLARPGLVPVVPDLPGLRFQVLHSLDAAEAYRLALVRKVRGAFNIAADPVIDAGGLAELLD